MKRALAATRAAVVWLAVTAMLTTIALVTSTPANAAVVTYTTTTTVNVRTGASTSKPVVTLLQAGQTVIAAGSVSGDWLPIRYDGKTAYAWAEYLKKDATPASVVTAGPVGRKTTLERVNVRATASLDADITTTVEKGQPVKVTGLGTVDFTQVRVGEHTRWIYTQFLSAATDTTPEPVAAFTTTAGLALRQTASVTATNQGTIAKGTTVGITGVHSGSYSQVVHSGKVGWVITGYLKATSGTPADLVLPIQTGTRWAAASGVNIRMSADAESAAAGTLAFGSWVRITGTAKNGFTEVIWDGTTRWVASGSLTSNNLDLGSDSLNKLEPNGKAAVIEVRAKFPQIKTIYGWRSSSAYSSDHPSGRAIDIMIPSYKTNRALGDAVAQYLIDNGKRLKVSYIIWRQRNYRISRGYWVKMSDRGGDTANHMDHVHASFEES